VWSEVSRMSQVRVKEATRERRTRNATTISLSAKRELLLSFFAAELFFFLLSPFDFVSPLIS
jgi:hypothetical protein